MEKEQTSQLCTYNEGCSLAANKFTFTGYLFTGWNTRRDGTGTFYQDGANVKNLLTGEISNGDGDMHVDLYAQWNAVQYTTSFNANGGTGRMEDATWAVKEQPELPPCGFIRDGYTFLQWNTAADGSGHSYEAGTYDYQVPAAGDGTVILYAVWEVAPEPGKITAGNDPVPVITVQPIRMLNLKKPADCSIYVDCSAEDPVYTWFSSSDGKHWTKKKEEQRSGLDFRPGTGISYYFVKVQKGDSSVCSDVCTVTCGTPEMEKIGWVYYSDGTVSEELEKKNNPVGIVCDVDPSGRPEKILSLEGSCTQWAPYHSVGYRTVFSTTSDDGQRNWKIIKKENPAGAENEEERYPAFYWCHTYKVKGFSGSWYLPASDEWRQILINSEAVEDGLFEANGGMLRLLPNNDRRCLYWSSSDTGGGGSVWCGTIMRNPGFGDDGVSGVTAQDKSWTSYVRAVARVK